MYMFTWTIANAWDERLNSDMYMNNDIIASTWSGPVGSEVSSNTVFIHCQSGARVYIQCGPDHACRTRAHYHGYQTFGGFLVTAGEG